MCRDNAANTAGGIFFLITLAITIALIVCGVQYHKDLKARSLILPVPCSVSNFTGSGTCCQQEGPHPKILSASNVGNCIDYGCDVWVTWQFVWAGQNYTYRTTDEQYCGMSTLPSPATCAPFVLERERILANHTSCFASSGDFADFYLDTNALDAGVTLMRTNTIALTVTVILLLFVSFGCCYYGTRYGPDENNCWLATPSRSSSSNTV